LATKLFCEVYVKCILPALRALVAKIMVKEYGLSQLDAAKILGVTQASINYYLSGKRGQKVLAELELIDEVRRIANEIARRLIEERRLDHTDYFCRLCILLKNNESLLANVLKVIGVPSVRVSPSRIISAQH